MAAGSRETCPLGPLDAPAARVERVAAGRRRKSAGVGERRQSVALPARRVTTRRGVDFVAVKARVTLTRRQCHFRPAARRVPSHRAARSAGCWRLAPARARGGLPNMTLANGEPEITFAVCQFWLGAQITARALTASGAKSRKRKLADRCASALVRPPAASRQPTGLPTALDNNRHT